MTNNLTRYIKYFVLMLLSIISIACTGGGSSGDSVESPPPAIFDGANGGVTADNPSTTNPMVVLKFKEAIQPRTVNKTTIALVKVDKQTANNKGVQNTEVSISDITPSADNTRFTLHPTESLAENSSYQIQIKAGILTASGAEVQPLTLNFTTGDITAPTVAMLEPSSDTNGIPTTPVIRFQFSESVIGVSPATVTLYQDSPTGAKLDAIGSILKGEDNIYSVVLKSTLPEDTKLYLVFSNEIKDDAGNELGAINFNFTTGDFTKPEVELLAPKFGGENIPRKPFIELKFSEAVNFSLNKVKLINSSGEDVALGNFQSSGNNVYSFVPQEQLSDGETYHVTFTNDIVDKAGNAVNSTGFYFTVGDNESPLVKLLAPLDRVNYANRTPIISIQFTEEVNFSDADISVHEGSESGPLVDISYLSSESAEHKYNYKADETLKEFTTYYVVINPSVADKFDNKLTGERVFSFITGDLVAPTATILSATTGTPLTPVIKLQFNESVQNVTNANIKVYESSLGGSEISVNDKIESYANNMYTFTLTNALKAGATYHVVLTDGITDGAGTSIDIASREFAFTTASSWSLISVGLDDSNTGQQNLTIAPDGTPYLAYNTCVNGGCKITVMKFNSSSQIWESMPQVTQSYIAIWPTLAIAPDGRPYIAYQDYAPNSTRSEDSGVTVKKFNGTNWEDVGEERFFKFVNNISLKIAPDGISYVSFLKHSNNRTEVRTFSDGTWQQVGGELVGLSNPQSLAIAPNGTLYIAYSTTGWDKMPIVSRLDNNQWVNTSGNTNYFPFGSLGVDWLSLTTAPDGTPYLTYRYKSGTGGFTHSYKLGNNGKWNSISSSTPVLTFQNIVLAPNGIPYISASNYDSLGMYIGYNSTFSNYGSNMYLIGTVNGAELDYRNAVSAMSPDGTFYVAYQDKANNNKTTVIKF